MRAVVGCRPVRRYDFRSVVFDRCRAARAAEHSDAARDRSGSDEVIGHLRDLHLTTPACQRLLGVDSVRRCLSSTRTSSPLARRHLRDSQAFCSLRSRSSITTTTKPELGRGEPCWRGQRSSRSSTSSSSPLRVRWEVSGSSQRRASSWLESVSLRRATSCHERAERAISCAGFPKRRINLAFAFISAAGYATQLILAAALLSNQQSAGLTRALVFMLVALFGSALARAWEVAGIGHRAPREGAPPSHGADSEVEVVPQQS